ncbi:cytochrome c oxidase subunit I [Streptomyces sp. JW3]|uniref:cytochrome c oxidase subunit I n=1 Tax=Streptomyces sp. JW3 TaxID=3456955 RepID=UPI003FA48791
MAVDSRTPRPREAPARPRTNRTLGRALVRWTTTTDHKVVGNLYLTTAFCFFLFAGLLAMLMRAELARPGLQLVTSHQYNQLFTVHGTIMMLLFATPLFAGFADAIMPLQIGAPDVAFPRLNALSYWLYLFGGLMVVGGFLTPGGAAAFGWFAYAPLNGPVFSPGTGGDLWTMGLVLSGVSTTLGAVNFITTILCLRAPGMTMFRMPIFTWNVLFTSILVLPAFPVLTMLSAVVWAHHMFATGAVLLPFFSLMSFLIAVPTGVKFFNWIGTMTKGSLSFETPMLWSCGFLVTFLLGGLSGVLIASPPLDFHLTDSYFIVAHLHYVLFGTVVFAMFGGFYFWWPKLTGRMLDERLGRMHFWTLFVGFQTTFLVQHWLGEQGMPRRYADYLAADGFTLLNTISSLGAFLLGLSTLPFLYNVWHTRRHGRVAHQDDPWGYGRSLEWATSSPPPRHNFHALPRIRSESPAFDLHHPDISRHDQRHTQ